MKCPKCGTTEDIKYFLRHQKENEDDTSDIANAITMLCTWCGYNQSYFLLDCLDEIFPDWSEVKTQADQWQEMLASMAANQSVILPEENSNVENEEENNE